MKQGAFVIHPHLPDEHLIKRFALRYGWQPESLTAVLSQFGPLSQTGQEQLIHCLVLASGRYQMLAPNVRRVTPSQQRNQLKAIEKTAKTLLRQLGVNPERVAPRPLWESLSDRSPADRLRALANQSQDGLGATMWLASAGIVTAGKDIATVNAELRGGGDRVADDVMALLDLYERARRSSRVATSRTTEKRGGSRRRPTAKGQLIRDALAIYAHMRERHPDSGAIPAFGGPMLRFIQAVAALFGAGVRDSEIRDVWRLWKSNRT